MRSCPTLSKAAYSAARAPPTSARDSSSAAAASASSSVARAMRWMRSPTRMRRPARSRIVAARTAIASGGSPHIR